MRRELAPDKHLDCGLGRPDFGLPSKIAPTRVSGMKGNGGSDAARSSCSLTSRVTSPPSARPLVSRMTAPMIGPIAFSLPDRTRSAASAFAANAAATISASSSPPPIAARPSASTIAAGSPPSATSLSSTWRPAPTLICLAATRPTSAASAPGSTREAAGSSPSPSRASRSPLTQFASACAGAGGSALRRERRLEVVAELAAEGELLRAIGAQRQLLLKARRTSGRQLAHRLARGRRASARRSARAAGRARGSSGSRAPPPSSAARRSPRSRGRSAASPA